MNIFDPSAYVRKTNYTQQQIDKRFIISEKKEEILDAKEYALTRSPNKKHGKRIYVSKKNGKVIAVSVSPINENFRSQIEDGVWEIIDSLIKKNYFTISSCEGHYGEGPLQFIIAIPDLEFAEKIRDAFTKIKYVSAHIRESSSNIEIDISNSKKPTFKRMEKEIVNYEEESKDINNMYFRTYKRYWFLRVHIYKKGRIWSLLQFFFNIFFEERCKKELIYLINSEKFPVNPY